MKQENFDTVSYRVALKFEDGSNEIITVTAADRAVVMMVARGWLMASALGVSVRYYRVDDYGRRMWYGGEFVR